MHVSDRSAIVEQRVMVPMPHLLALVVTQADAGDLPIHSRCTTSLSYTTVGIEIRPKQAALIYMQWRMHKPEDCSYRLPSVSYNSHSLPGAVNSGAFSPTLAVRQNPRCEASRRAYSHTAHSSRSLLPIGMQFCVLTFHGRVTNGAITPSESLRGGMGSIELLELLRGWVPVTHELLEVRFCTREAGRCERSLGAGTLSLTY